MGNSDSKQPSDARYTRVGIGLKQFPADQLTGKRSVEVVNLSCNRISGTIDVTAFSKLQTLTLWGNDLSAVPLRLDRTLANLRTLDLGCNFLQEFPNGLGQACPALMELNLSGNQIRYISNDDLRACAKLRVLKLQHNMLEELPETMSSLLELHILYLHANRLTSLPLSLAKCKQLQELQVGENQIRQLPDNIFEGLNELQTFNLTANSLERVPSSIWTLPKLQTLRLPHNNISDLGYNEDSPPEPMASLDTLELCHNSICMIPNGLVSVWAMAAIIYISHNGLQTLPENVGKLIHVERLDISYNKLQQLPSALSGTLALQELYLGHNCLSGPDANLEVIGKCVSLTTVYLNNNGIAECPSYLSRLPYLKVINLAGNNLKTFNVSPRALLTSKLLGDSKCSVDLSMNKFDEFPSVVYKLEAVEDFKFHGNCIKALPDYQKLVNNNKRLKALSLTIDAPFAKLSSFADSLRRSHRSIVRIYIDNIMTCIALETENVHKAERGLFHDQHKVAKQFVHAMNTKHGHVGAAQITGSASHPIEDRMVVKHLSDAGLDVLAMFDGHAGDHVANMAQAQFPAVLENLIGQNAGSAEDVQNAVVQAFQTINNDIRSSLKLSKDSKAPTCGSTAVAAVVSSEFIVCGNAGDSKAYIIATDSNGADKYSITRLSTDHKPGCEDEWARIRNAGGYITERLKPGAVSADNCRLAVPRKDGGFQSLAVSRSLGDYHCAPSLSGDPSVHIHQRTKLDCFLLLVSDGISDVISDEEIMEFVIAAEVRKRRDHSRHICEPFEQEAEVVAEADPKKRENKMRSQELDSIAFLSCLQARCKGTMDDSSMVIFDLKN